MCKILIDDTEFKNIQEGAKFLEIPRSTLGAILPEKDEIKINGFNVRRVGIRRKFTKMVCLETGEVFNTMTALSKAVGIDVTYISKECLETGKFVHNGKTYVRSDPSELTREVTNRKQSVQNNVKVVVEEVKADTTKKALEELAKRAIDENDYDTVVVLIEALKKLGY